MIYVMSGGAKAFAVIGVTYPAGSGCTCTDGTKTLKLKETSGQGLFLIPYAATWTVSCTDGTNTQSESVEITSEGQSESVALSYDLVLYSNGSYIVPFTAYAGTCGSVIAGDPTITNNPTHFIVSQPIGSAGSYVSGKIVDTSDYKTLTLEYEHIATSTNGSWDCVICLMNSPTDNWYSQYVAKNAIPITSGKSVLTVDLSGVNGNYYVLFGLYDTRQLYVYDLRFEK